MPHKKHRKLYFLRSLINNSKRKKVAVDSSNFVFYFVDFLNEFKNTVSYFEQEYFSINIVNFEI